VIVRLNKAQDPMPATSPPPPFRSTDKLAIGVVAEPLSGANKNRYLIFFDNGQEGYHNSSDVSLVYGQDDNIFDSLANPDQKKFLWDYLKPQPNVPLFQGIVGQLMEAKVSEMWKPVKVLAIDCSMVKVQLISDPSSEHWIYQRRLRVNGEEPEDTGNDMDTGVKSPKAKRGRKRPRPHESDEDNNVITENSKNVKKRFADGSVKVSSLTEAYCISLVHSLFHFLDG